MDYISIKNLEVFSKHGVFEEENRLGQKFAVDAILYLNTREASVRDDIDLSVDYGRVCHFITAFMKDHTFKLIETVANRLAEDILLEFPFIDKIKITVKKPWAPIGLPLEEVSVNIERGWHKVFLALGANMGDKEENIKCAVNALDSDDKIQVMNVASLITTEPYGNTNQDKFVNGAIEIKTLYEPLELLKICKELEKSAGRIKTEHWGPRPLDIDIIFYDNEIIDLENLTVPHIDMCNRSFVLEPLNEIAPYFRHPVNHKTISELLDDLNSR